MMGEHIKARKIAFGILVASLICINGLAGHAYASLTVNILAVNGTNEPKEKEITHYLPHELGAEDILDTAGLALDYDVNKEAFFVSGTVKLKAKETQTLRVKIKDVWMVEEETIDSIKNQIDASYKQIENTKYADSGAIKKSGLNQRLDHIMLEQSRYAEHVGKRIDRFRIYEKELNKIRGAAVSVAFWRSNPADQFDNRTVKLNVTLENSSQTESKVFNDKHYLPSEVKPEHIIDFSGFDLRFDPMRGQSYLTKEEELRPLEKKEYTFEIIDIWTIPQVDIDNLRTRAQRAYDLVIKTKYIENANFLIKSINAYLEKIELAQQQILPIKQHISAYRKNLIAFEKAEEDVKALESILNAVRENLERSPLKKVLQKIKALKSLRDVAKAMFKIKPKVKKILKIIISIVIFVGTVTIVHFVIWGRRSKELEIKNREKDAK